MKQQQLQINKVKFFKLFSNTVMFVNGFSKGEI